MILIHSKGPELHTDLYIPEDCVSENYYYIYILCFLEFA